jgi:hypothetical protein
MADSRLPGALFRRLARRMRLLRFPLLASLLVVSASGGATAAPSAAPPQRPSTASGGAPGDKAPQKPRTEVLSVEASLARATAFYEAGQYGQCASAFETLLGDPTQAASLAPRAREQANVYHAACLIALGRTDEADAAFRDVIRENPQMTMPNPIVFPPAVIERFVVVRTTLMEEIRRAEAERATRAREAALQAQRRAEAEKARMIYLERLASQETLVTQNQRWLAWVPFGVGQFQNRQVGLGVVFLTSEVLLLGTALGAVTIELSLNSQAGGGAGLKGDINQLNQNLYTANEVALIATGAFILVAGAGILQANLAFVPEFEGGVRQRKKPPRAASGVSFMPTAGPVSGGAALGVLGRF